MTPDESGALVAALLPAEHRPSNIALLLRALTARLMEWPLLLKLAAGVIRGRLERDDTFEKALEYVTSVYNKYGLIAFDPKDAVERNDAVAKSIDASLEQLDKDDKEGRTRLRELVMFPEDTDVPLRMIELLWGLDDLDTQQTVELLDNYRLVDLDLREGLVRLHDEIHSYHRRSVGKQVAAIYQLRVVLCGVSPLVWRRLLVVSTISIAELHEILQNAFGWSGEHLHRFLIHGAAMGFRVLAALSSGKMPDGCRFLVSVCIAASASAMNTTPWPIGSWAFGWSELCLIIPTALFHPVSAEAELRRPKTALEPWIILSGWIGTEAQKLHRCGSWASLIWAQTIDDSQIFDVRKKPAEKRKILGGPN